MAQAFEFIIWWLENESHTKHFEKLHQKIGTIEN